MDDAALRWLDRPLRFSVVGDPTKGNLPGAFRDRLAAHDLWQAIQSRGWNAIGESRGSDFWRSCLVGRLEWASVGYRREPVYTLSGEPLDVQWADVDHCGRLLLSRAGRILVRDERDERELIDLSPYEFQPVAPPGWAREWPE